MELSILNGSFCLICVAILVFAKSVINKKAFKRVNEELLKNMELNKDLDRKVKNRTLELEEKNQALKNIESTLKKYLPIQLVTSIKKGGQAAIESVSTHQRKKLTFFFSDIKDFTSMTDGMEPEDIATLLNEYFSEMDVIINRYQGTLAQVTGDALLVFFGAPETTDDRDHAIRCVRMAVDMQMRMDELQDRWFNRGIDEVFKIRCGINTGMATVGSFGSSMRKLYTAHGMPVNIAARLEQACEPGSILISHSTWALVKDEIACNDQGQMTVKGSHKPIRAYKVDSEYNSKLVKE